MEQKALRRVLDWLHGDPEWVRRDPFGRFSAGSSHGTGKRPSVNRFPKVEIPRQRQTLTRAHDEAVQAFTMDLPGGYRTSNVKIASVKDKTFLVRGDFLDPDGNVVGTFTRDIGYIEEIDLIDPMGEVVHTPGYMTPGGDPMLIASHDIAKLDPDHRGKGLVPVFNHAAAMWYDSVGVDAVKVEAGDSGGGYVWARTGFGWDRQQSLHEVGGSVPMAIRDAIRDIEKRGGERWGVQEGEDTEALLGELRHFLADAENDFESVTPKQIAMLGMHDARWTEMDSEGKPVQMWPGKKIMLGTRWEGIDRQYQEHFAQAAQIALAKQHIDDALAGGFTYDPITGAVPTDGYQIAPRDASVPIPFTVDGDRDLLAEMISDAIDAQAWRYEDREMKVGGWYSESTQSFVLDPSEHVVTSRTEAEILGFQRDQEGIWDNVNFEVIPTGGSGGRPRSKTEPEKPGWKVLEPGSADRIDEERFIGHHLYETDYDPEYGMGYQNYNGQFDVPDEARALVKIAVNRNLRDRISKVPGWEDSLIQGGYLSPRSFANTDPPHPGDIAELAEMEGISDSDREYAFAKSQARSIREELLPPDVVEGLNRYGYFGGQTQDTLPGIPYEPPSSGPIGARLRNWEELQSYLDLEDFQEERYSDTGNAYASDMWEAAVRVSADMEAWARFDPDEEPGSSLIATGFKPVFDTDFGRRVATLTEFDPEQIDWYQVDPADYYTGPVPATAGELSAKLALGRAVRDTIDGWAASSQGPGSAALQGAATRWAEARFGVKIGESLHLARHHRDEGPMEDFYRRFLDATYDDTQEYLEAEGMNEVTLFRGWHGTDKDEEIIPALEEWPAILDNEDLTQREKFLAQDIVYEMGDGTTFAQAVRIVRDREKRRILDSLDASELPEARNIPYAELDAILDSFDAGDFGFTRRGEMLGRSHRPLHLNALSSWSTSPSVASMFSNSATGGGSGTERWRYLAGVSVPRENILATSNTGVGALHETEAVLIGVTVDGEIVWQKSTDFQWDDFDSADVEIPDWML